MKLHRILVFVTALGLFAACDRNSGEAQKLAAERAALEREKAELGAAKTAAEKAANEEERAKLDAERAALAAEKARLAGDTGKAAEAERAARVAAEREARIAAERRAADETVKREAAEMREREAQEAAEDAAEDVRAAQSVEFFYEALDPYGDWVNLERYGYCWRPKVAAGWRPYTDGSWVFTEYGWTWRANEPFGWAVYHYGRWTRAPRLGWIWVPGTEWGPAWVSWRRSDEYVGWAPLPPDAWSSSGFGASVDAYFNIGPGLYTFLRVVDFGEPSYVSRVLSQNQNVTVINKTVNVTNVTYKRVQNKVTVVNNGPDLAAINAHSQRPVQRLNVERIEAGKGAASKVEGDKFRIVAPRMKDQPDGAKPKKVKEQVKAAELDHGWAEAKGEEQKIRESAQAEAQRAEDEERAGAKETAPAEGRKRIRVIGKDGQLQPAAPADVAPVTPPAAPDGRKRIQVLPRPGAEVPQTVPPAQPAPGTPPTPAAPATPPAPSIPERMKPQRPDHALPATPPAAPERVKPPHPERPAPPADAPPREPGAATPEPREPKKSQRPPAADQPKPAKPEGNPHDKKKGEDEKKPG